MVEVHCQENNPTKRQDYPHLGTAFHSSTAPLNVEGDFHPQPRANSALVTTIFLAERLSLSKADVAIGSSMSSMVPACELLHFGATR